MIFINNQLMKTESQVRLFAVSNPMTFTSFENHMAAIFIRLYDLIEEAKDNGENPVGMIEDYLQTSYHAGDNVADIAAFLIQTGAMEKALWDLKDNWSAFDASLPEDSLVFGGLSKEESVAIYQETTLKSYLESLSTVFD